MKVPCAQLLLGASIGVNASNHRYLHEAMNGERVSGYGKYDVPEWKPIFFDESPPHRGVRVPRESWTLTCSSVKAGSECKNAIDGTNKTAWRSDSRIGEHSITVDLRETHTMNAVVILPPIDLTYEKDVLQGLITHHEVYVSDDQVNWKGPVAYGMWSDANRQRMSVFEPIPARYLKLITRGGGKYTRTWAGISEINIYATTYTIPQDPTRGIWGPTVDFPVIPVAGAQEASGKILVWSSWASDEFHSSPGGKTAMSRWDPITNEVSKLTVTNTHHDMFCPGISMDGTGVVVVSGGNDAAETSLYNSLSHKWEEGPYMNVERGYQSSTTLSDGRVFLIGGSFSGGSNIAKNGEVYDPWTKLWTNLPEAKVKPMLTDDYERAFRSDNHAWLFGWKNETVFQAGPSVAMNWYYMEDEGDFAAAGHRLRDEDSMCGNAVMFDAVNGKILTFGGSQNYDNDYATANAHIITLGEPGEKPTVKPAGKNGLMHYERTFHTSVVLPDGKVFIAGGQTFGRAFNEENVQFVPEIYDPDKDAFVQLQQHNFIRVYHHLSLLLPDARVLTGGGGLCGNCSSNHYDGQIYTPPYLLTESGEPRPRPQIVSAFPNNFRVRAGAVITFTADAEIKNASLVRLGSASHTVNTDQRRVPLTVSRLSPGEYQYTVKLPSDLGILIPGYWMLFVMNNDGVPSIAKTIMVVVDPKKKSAGTAKELSGEPCDEHLLRKELIK